MEPETNLERRQRNEVAKNRIIYSLPVRIGNWYNDWLIKQENQYIYNYQKDHGQLLVQKTKRMLDNLLSPTTLENASPYLLYGKQYQIKSVTNQPFYLSGLVRERDIDTNQNLCDGCLLTASQHPTPCCRNTFLIIDPNDRNRQGYVNYGDDVYLQIINTNNNNNQILFVQCENPTIDSFGEHSSLNLTQYPDIYSRFKIYDWQTNLQYRTIGQPIHHNSCIIIKHTASGRKLTVELNKSIRTFFGNEYKVSCYTCRNCQIGENLWRITGQLLEKIK